MENLFWIGFIGALVAGLFAVMQAKKVLSYSEGSEKMRKIAANIRSGANAYLKQQYTTVFKVFIVVFVYLVFGGFKCLAVQQDLALVGMKNIHYDPDSGCLSGTVSAQQSQRPAALDGEVYSF